jgi:hypothetical protein
MFVQVAKSNVDFLYRNLDNVDAQYDTKYLNLLRNVNYGNKYLKKQSFDWNDLCDPTRYTSSQLRDIIDMLVKTGAELNAEYDKKCKERSSFTFEGKICKVTSNTSLCIEDGMGFGTRIFADRLGIKLARFSKENVGRKVRITGFLSTYENNNIYDGMPVADSIEFI